MQKIKFQINGMHCNSCATLIEERLKEQAGVQNAKVSFDSKKAVVLFDETKVNESDIAQTIEKTGDYKVEKIEEENKKEEEAFQQGKQKSSFSAGIFVGIALISIAFNIYFLTSINKSLSAAGANNQNNNQAVKQQDTQAVAGATVQNFDITSQNHVRGNFNAPVTLVEFSDFECPFCEKIYPTLGKILNDYQDKVRLVYKYFLLSFHPNAQKAAESAECAAEQGKFWEYHDKLFEKQPDGFSLDKFKIWAEDLGLDTQKFNNCLDSGKYASKVQADFQEGQKKGVSGTPSTFINGQLIVGAQSYESFKQIIDGLLK